MKRGIGLDRMERQTNEWRNGKPPTQHLARLRSEGELKFRPSFSRSSEGGWGIRFLVSAVYSNFRGSLKCETILLFVENHYLLASSFCIFWATRQRKAGETLEESKPLRLERCLYVRGEGYHMWSPKIKLFSENKYSLKMCG